MKEQSQVIEQLIDEMKLRNYSSFTIRAYSELLTKVAFFFETDLENITSEQFKSYLLHRLEIDNVSISMINQAISAFKILQTDVLKKNWESIKIKRPRREKKLPVVLSLAEVEKVLAVTKNIKHKAILMLAYSAGLRRSEIQKIKPIDIDSSRMKVKVTQGKGKKDRFSLLSLKTLEILRHYYKQEKPTTYLFEVQGKKGKPLSVSTLNKIVKNSAQKAGIKKNISFHTLRHCFATHMLEQGVNIKIIQSLMGHVSIKTTSIYLHIAQDHSSVISPLDLMNISILNDGKQETKN